MRYLPVSHHIFYIVSIILLLFFSPVKTYAETSPAGSVNSLLDGAWALQFQFRDGIHGLLRLIRGAYLWWFDKKSKGKSSAKA